ncbi:MAG TPA: DUF6776 family protein [Burkholderiaceae bacterium]|nr:DUF6776 family protein [Burkholderiaceae bacterium]
MKWKLFFRNLSVSSPQVTIRSRLSWPLRLVLAFIFATIAAAAGVAIYEFGRDFGGPDRRSLQAEIDRLNAQVLELTAERDRNAAQATAYESELKVQMAAQEQLLQQVTGLEAEQTRMQGDLSFFESLLPAGKGDKGVVIRSFRVQPDAETSKMRYRLLVQQSGKPDKDFVGSVQLRVNFTQNSRGFTLQVPDVNAAPETLQGLQLSFRHYQRVEGGFSLPPGAVARSVQVRILAGGETQLQQTFNL